jgi:hypothetical protein
MIIITSKIIPCALNSAFNQESSGVDAMSAALYFNHPGELLTGA